MNVVTDTGPIHYLVLIDEIEVLPALFGAIVLPDKVASELQHPKAPPRVQDWLSRAPRWATIAPSPQPVAGTERLDEGERAAIALALKVGADLVLMDDRDGVTAARGLGLKTIGTVGVIDRAAKRGLLDLNGAVGRLRATNFHASPRVFAALLARRD